MTGASRTPRASTAQIVVEILELLAAHTDREHGLSAAEIAQRLGVNEKTVRTHLRAFEAMSPLGRRVGHLDRADLVHAESADPRPGWTIEPVFDTAQMRLLTDGAMLSRPDGEYLRDLIAKIYSFAGRSGQLRGLSRLDTPKNYNTEFLNNIELLNDAIDHERVITFHYCTYDENGDLVPRRRGDGTVREYRADPYHLMYKNNMYYLVCHMHVYEGLSYLHVERFRDLRVDGTDHSITHRLDDFSDVPGEPFDIDRHMAERPYPVTGPAVPIRMRITGSLEPLFDWFDDARVTRVAPPRGDDGGAGDAGGVGGDAGRRARPVYKVRVVANEKATLWWALQYADGASIEIVEPASLRARLREVGERLAATYAATAAPDGTDAAVASAGSACRLRITSSACSRSAG
ncbi:helix-turn-helix transcriptional regulator [Bifidobacterium stellenboschense]|uniref:Putative transcriptional regulator n=1 Tax=Bifidobacterium stellenboschense TaxID=762211 RepID=A0A087DHC6_9BIFI|nr:WYL domain-containing protein [Bifidobacterium stellenboschense]KFI94926.1 putative transcriptional regulator [Bifidobacterium stellenboschense]